MEIRIYDGATTIGGNKIYVEEGGKGLFLDFGMNFAKYGDYFQEFLRERATRGIHDLLHLDLIPKLNVYRTDLIPSDVDITRFPKLNVEAVLLSHAHLDHCGNIGLLHEGIPVIATPTTLAVLKAMRDTSHSLLGSEIAYYSPRKPGEDDRVLTSQKSKVYAGRDFICTDEVNDELMAFLTTRPGEDEKAKKKFQPGSIYHIDETELGYDVAAFEIDHSIYGAAAYVIYGDIAIAYTGDIRAHGRQAEKTREFVRNAKDASVLIIEGTRASREDYNESEKIVFENCLKAVEEAKGLVIADFSPRNFERLETFKEIAEKTGRQLVITAKDAYMLHALEQADGIDRMHGLAIYCELKDRKEKWEKFVRNEWEEHFIDPKEIATNQSGYILCFSFNDMKHLLDIKPSGGVYIYSSSEAFTEEQEFDFLRLYNWLVRFGFDIRGFELVFGRHRPKPRFIKGYHASGHASKEDLRWIIESVDPDVIIPVHTDNPGWFEENFENVKVLKDGESIEFN
ncbi:MULTISPECIES: MBL fold metallo-hydrolase RNA specificity domain-containing protein [unclassified Archaeoglobus]|uniref:MBL fold metallo-hydrolase RNA specificity domain-containing protein n=1 Tax=unclassified Archaeoglobus TaxID=2643606 RepID=UPI0025B80968|nr:MULTISPECIES: ribonuclease J [unclassified Archaeoglobus]